MKKRRRFYASTLTRTILFPARRVNSELSFTDVASSFLSSPSTFTAFCLTLREPSETESANPMREARASPD